MPDLTVLYTVGAALTATGLLLIAVLARRRAGRHTPGGQLPQAWAEYLPPPREDLEDLEDLTDPGTPASGGDVATELIPAVPPASPARHWFPGAAPDRNHIPLHDVDTIGWRIVPEGWAPPVGAARIAAALDSTQRHEWVIP